MSDKIIVKQCPKCGGDPVWNEIFSRYRIECSKCGFIGPPALNDLKLAVEKWNSLRRDK